MSEDFFPVRGYDHVEFYVGNAKQAAHFYDRTLGFRPVAKRGLETGSRDRASYVMQQGNITFVFTSALGPDHEVARHCALHGDGVKAIALSVPDVDAALREAHSRGATVLKQARANGKLVLGMKIFGAGKLTKPQQKDASLKYVLQNELVDAVTVGMMNPKEVDDTIRRMNRVLKA